MVVGCGSSAKQKPVDPAQAAREARRKEIEAMKPAHPYEVRDRLVYRPTDRCGQGPYRVELDSMQVKYGEQLVVYACGKHEISGNYRLTTQRKTGKPSSDESAFGWGRDNAACKAREVSTTSAASGGGGGVTGTGGGKVTGAPTATAPASIKPVALERATEIPTDCTRTSILNMTWYQRSDEIALDGHVMVDIWSDEPNDFEGLGFVVERSAVVADMTPERWQAYLEADKAHHRAYMANLEVEVKAGRTKILDDRVKTPPPPPPRAETPSPKPSKNARWIPGYWLYAEAKFHWIAGLWDVPEADIKAELTVQAPKPPPPEPVREAPPQEPRPTTTAVWTPGSWQWDGKAYVWIEGAWRIPPDAQHTWQKPTWTVNAGKAIYVPGGWRIRVRLGR